MPVRIKKRRMRENVRSLDVPREKWSRFLQTFSRQHRGRRVQLETHDLVTGEKVLTQETPVDAIELDLEDEKNPRINVVVQLDNKVIKHILFQPSRLVVQTSEDNQEQSLLVETVNTETLILFRAPATLSSE